MMQRTLLACALFLGCCLLAEPARADNIDKELLKRGAELLKTLRQRGYKNIGVLKFAVKKGTQEPTFNAGPINMNLANRLENVLILVNDEKNPIGIIHDATGVAAASDAKASYRTPIGRQNLFKQVYPLFWGKDRVQPDAFLTGLIDVTDLSRTSVQVQVFDRKTVDLETLVSFKVPTDRSILAETNTPYYVSRVSLLRSRSAGDDEAVLSAKQTQEEKKPIAPQSYEKLVDLEVRYDDVPQPITREGLSQSEETVIEPRANQKVAFCLTNVSKLRVGVVIKVNGKSTLREEEQDDIHCIKWILEPGEKYMLRGFYDDLLKKVYPFEVQSDEETARLFEASPSDTKLGVITMTTFREAGGVKDELRVSTRGLTSKQLKAKPPPTLADAKKLIAQTITAGVPRGLLGKGNQGEDQSLNEMELKDPQPVETRIIRYIARK